MSNRKKYLIAIFTTFVIIGSPSIYYLFKQVRENKIIDAYLNLRNLKELPIGKEAAVHIADQVRLDFNTDEKKFTSLKMHNRPFLREDTGFFTFTYGRALWGRNKGNSQFIKYIRI